MRRMKLTIFTWLLPGLLLLATENGWGQTQQPAAKSQDYIGKLLSLLEQSGYRYGKVGDGVWEIPATGDNVKEFSIRLALAEDVLLAMARIADRKNLVMKEGLLTKLLALNHQFDSAKLALSEEMLYARIDLHARLVDVQELKYLVEQVANVVDETYPQIKQFIIAAQ